MSDKTKNEIINDALKKGVTGSALGALLTGKGKGTIVSALVGAAIGASVKAQKEAKKLSTPVLYEEDSVIYRVYPNGDREVVMQLAKQQVTVPSTFTIE